MRALIGALVAWVALGVWLVPAVAHADCMGDPNMMPCGQFCIANGRVCCESIGHPELSCPGGTRCNAADLKCYDECDDPSLRCDNGCMPPGNICCEAGDGHSCPSSHVCAADGSCTSLVDGCAVVAPDEDHAGFPRGFALLFAGLVLVVWRKRSTVRR